MKNMKFDIDTFNKNRTNDTYKFVMDNMEIIQEDWEDQYVEYIRPIGKFYNVLNTYYLNGNLKKHGIRLNDGPLIKIWEYYDEQGKLIKTIDEDAKFGNVPFDYNKVILWLDKKRYISIEKGEVYINYSFSFNSKKKYWWIDVYGEYKTYLLDGQTGRIIGGGEINPIK